MDTGQNKLGAQAPFLLPKNIFKKYAKSACNYNTTH